MSDVRSKIKKLLAVAAEGSGATDAERDTARQLAKKLMERHGIDPAGLAERPKFEFVGREDDLMAKFMRKKRQAQAFRASREAIMEGLRAQFAANLRAQQQAANFSGAAFSSFINNPASWSNAWTNSDTSSTSE